MAGGQENRKLRSAEAVASLRHLTGRFGNLRTGWGSVPLWMLVIFVTTPYVSAADNPHIDLSCNDCHAEEVRTRLQQLRRERQIELEPGHSLVREAIKLSEADRLQLHDRCRDCHPEEAQDWQHSGHAVSYASIFLDRRHNKRLLLNDDCLRCHGMFFAGTIHDLVTPIDTQGPWRMREPARRADPTIPCLACHQIHPAQYTVVTPSSSAATRRRKRSSGPLRFL